MTYYGKIFEWMGKIVDAIKEKIGNLELKAIELGKDMLKGFIDGIKVKTGKLGDSVKSISEKIKNFLYFSKPDLGPLRDYETWMQDMIKGMAESIKGSTHLLEKATDQMANKIANGLSFSSIVDNTTKAMKSLGYDVRTSLNPMNNQNANSLLLENQNINSNVIRTRI